MGQAVARLCLVASFIILETFDGEELPKWHYGITLNTIDAPTPPGCRRPQPDEVALWHRQRSNPHGRTMLDFQDIDKASRGAYGSLPSLWKARYG